MVRRNFADRLVERGVDVKLEFRRILKLFYEETFSTHSNPFDRIVYCIDRRFRELPSSNRALSLEDFENYYGYNFHGISNPTLDDLLDICEYCFNFAYEYRELNYNCELRRYFCPKEIHHIIKQISDVIEAIGYMPVKYNRQTVFVEKSPAAVSVSEILEGDIALETLFYNHHSMKGDIMGKRKMLLMMANWLEGEGRRDELDKIDSKLRVNLFYLFNNFNIRHNNSDTTAHLTEAELEEIYDDTYQLWLLAVLTLDNRERQKKYEEMRKSGNT